MKHSWRKGLLPLAVGLALGVAGLAFAHLAGLTPDAWVEEGFFEFGPLQQERVAARGFTLFSLAFLAIPLAPLVAGRSLPVIGCPPLYAASWLLLPVFAAVAAFDLDWIGPQAARTLGASSPEHLAQSAFFAWPLAILLATLVPANSSRATLKGVTLVLGFVLLGAWVCWLRFGPAELADPRGRWILVSLLAVAAGVAFFAWRSQAGVGGGAAAVAVWCGVAGLTALGADEAQHRLEQRGLPGAVRPDQSDELADGNPEVHALDRGREPRVAGGEVAHDEGEALVFVLGSERLASGNVRVDGVDHRCSLFGSDRPRSP